MGDGNSDSFSYLYIHAIDLPTLIDTSLAVSRRFLMGNVNLYSMVEWFIYSPKLRDSGVSYEQNPDNDGCWDNIVKANTSTQWRWS